MHVSADSCGPPLACQAVLAESNSSIDGHYRWKRRLVGGEQSGAHLVVEDGSPAVLKWEPAGWKAGQLLRAFPAVVHATDGGWSAARWLAAGPLSGGGAFVLQEYVEGRMMSDLDVSAVRAVLAANVRQSGLAFSDADDHSAQLEAVLSGDQPWKSQVAGFTAAGSRLVEHGDEVAAWAVRVSIPTSDVVHGDYSSSNILLAHDRSSATFVDCQTVGRGSRVRDLAALYRQSFVYPVPRDAGTSLLRAAAIAVEGPEVFAKCAVAVTYNNLAWWAENKTAFEFDRACARLHWLFDGLRHPPGYITASVAARTAKISSDPAPAQGGDRARRDLASTMEVHGQHRARDHQQAQDMEARVAQDHGQRDKMGADDQQNPWSKEVRVFGEIQQQGSKPTCTELDPTDDAEVPPADQVLEH